MLNFLKRSAKIKEPSKPLDPYLVGAVCGSNAFGSGDWVVIRCDGNRPGKVVQRHSSDFPGAVRVVLNRDNYCHIESCYGAGDLGYPLTRQLWSESQSEWYQKCHKEEHFINLAKSFSDQTQGLRRPNKQFDIGDYLEEHRSTFFSLSLYFVNFVLAAALWGLLTNPQAVAPIIIRIIGIIVIAGLIFFAYVVK